MQQVLSVGSFLDQMCGFIFVLIVQAGEAEAAPAVRAELPVEIFARQQGRAV